MAAQRPALARGDGAGIEGAVPRCRAHVISSAEPWQAFPAMRLERVIDVIVLGILIMVMVRAPSDLVRGASLVASLMLVALWAVAWRRRK